jgi:hypothetical protein
MPNETTPTSRFQYTVTVSVDGSVLIDPKVPEDKTEDVLREATIIDIMDTSRKLISDLERQILMDGLNEVISSLSPQEPAKVSDTVKDALKERGITPEA